MLPGCGVSVALPNGGEAFFVVQPRHYEDTKDRLDRRETGWIELDSIHGDGRLFCRLEDIRHLFLATESFATERDEWERHEKVADG